MVLDGPRVLGKVWYKPVVSSVPLHPAPSSPWKLIFNFLPYESTAVIVDGSPFLPLLTSVAFLKALFDLLHS